MYIEKEVEVKGKKLRLIHIPTATSEMWIVVADECSIYGAVCMALNGTVVSWINPPRREIKAEVEQKIREAFELGVY